MKTDRQIIEEKGNEYGLAHLTDLMDAPKEITLAFIEVWLVNRFGSVDRYYREEWLNRYTKYGYFHFIGHMDGNSLHEWDKLGKQYTKATKGAKK